MRTLKRPLRLLLGLLFHRPCLACGLRQGDPAEAGCCDACWKAVDALPRPVLGLGSAWAQAAFPYEGLLRDLVLAWKFDGRSALVRPLAARMAGRLEGALAGSDLAFDAVTSVPASASGMRQRGFDPAGDLGRELAARLGRPYAPALRLRRERARQSRLGQAGREANARGAFAALPGARGRRYLLVDDLVSTGATARDAIQALEEGGAGVAGLVALAHALKDR